MKIASENSVSALFTEDEPLSAAEIFDLYRKKFSLEEAKQKLSDWLEIALTTENLFYDDHKSREELYSFYHMLTYVTEGIWSMENNLADK